METQNPTKKEYKISDSSFICCLHHNRIWEREKRPETRREREREIELAQRSKKKKTAWELSSSMEYWLFGSLSSLILYYIVFCFFIFIISLTGDLGMSVYFIINDQRFVFLCSKCDRMMWVWGNNLYHPTFYILF